MGTGASIPKEKETATASTPQSKPSSKSIPPPTPSAPTTPAQKIDAKPSAKNVVTPITMEEYLGDEAGDKQQLSNNKLKKMALGIQGYKEKDRDYDQTLAQMDFNKTQKVEWSEPKSPEKQLTSKSSKDNIALEMKHDASSPSLRPYSNSRNMEFSPMSTLQPKSSQQNVLSPGTMGPRPLGTPAPGPPPGVAVRPFAGNISSKGPNESNDVISASPQKGQPPPYNNIPYPTPTNMGGMVTPVKNNAAHTLSSPGSQHYIVTPMNGPGNIPVRPFNAAGNMLSPSVSISNVSTSNKGGSAPMMMAIPPNAVRGSAPVQVPMGGNSTIGVNNNNNNNPYIPAFSSSGPPQMIMGPNGIPINAVPIGALPVGAIPMGAVPISLGAIPMGAIPVNAPLPMLVPASPAGVLAATGPGMGPNGPRGIPANGAPLPVVKETKDVKRNKAQLPSNLTHARPTTGDWLNKRYIVNNYILLDVLGTGSYGEVRLCKDRNTERLYAIKIISKDFLKKRKNGKSTETYFEDIKREIAIMKKLLHPNILRLYEVLDDPKVNKMYLVLEYMKKGDLINILKKRDGANDGDFQPLSDFEVWQIFRQLVVGIRYLHFQNIVHGDIKPQNLLLGDDGIVKIADFGISQMLSGSDEQLHDAGGTPAFMAPELCEGKKNFSGQLADIWAIGASIFMLRFGSPPFVAKSIINLYYKICNDPLVFPSALDPGLQNIIEGMLEKNPDKRLTIPQIVAHPWYRQPPPPPTSNSNSNTAGNGSSAVPGPPPPIGSSPMAVNPASKPSRPSTSSSSSSASATATPSNNNGSRTGGNNSASAASSTSAALTVVVGGSVVPTFQPPPSYDAEADEAMKGPIHRTALNNDDVFMSIGNISVTDQEEYDGAIGEVIEEGDDESDEDDEDDSKSKGNHPKKVKAADKVRVRNREDMEAQEEKKIQQGKEDAKESTNSKEEVRDRLGRKIKPVVQPTSNSDSDEDDEDEVVGTVVSKNRKTAADGPQSEKKVNSNENDKSLEENAAALMNMDTGTSDMMGTNWGADVFQMVEDDEDGGGGDDDDEEVDDDSNEGQDRFDPNNIHATTTNNQDGHHKMARKESHSEMSEEEEARRSRRFMKKNTKKSTENMMRSLPSNDPNHQTTAGGGAVESSKHAGNKGKGHGNNNNASGMTSSSSTAGINASQPRSAATMSKSQSQPSSISASSTSVNHNSSSSHNNHASANSSAVGLNSLNTSSTSSSPYLKPGSRSARGDPSRTFSMNSTFDDDEPEPLTNEEFQAMMDTLSQQNTQGSRFDDNDSVEGSERKDSDNSNTSKDNSKRRGDNSDPSSAQSTAVGGNNSHHTHHTHLRNSSGTDQSLIDAAMAIVWEQIDVLQATYINNRVKIGGAFHSEQGIRPSQEDRCVLLPNVAAMQALAAYDLNPGTKEQLNMFALAGIFDGHDGWRSSQYLSQYLATMLVTHDKFLDPKQLNNAINDTFTTIDIQLCDLLREEEDNSGSTAVVAVYDGRKKTLTVAGVGDSLCVLCRNGHAVEMNKMHRVTDNAAERERVKNAGGTIINSRVNGVLAVSRSFGDTPFKTLHELQTSHSVTAAAAAANSASVNPSGQLRPPVKTNNVKAKLPLHRLVNDTLVTAVPEIYTEIITPKTEFALLASDGLWDTMTPQLAISFIRDFLSKEKDLHRAAQAVVQEALRRGSIDNVTVLILSFNTGIQQGS